MIYLGADQHGLKVIKTVEEYLKSQGVEFINLGIQNEGEDISLQELIPKVTNEVLKDKKDTGILSCGTGVGIEVGANKLKGIRACLATDEKIAEYARVYDDCNVLCLVGWDNNEDKVRKILKAWLKSDYDGNPSRLEMFKAFDVWGGQV